MNCLASALLNVNAKVESLQKQLEVAERELASAQTEGFGDVWLQKKISRFHQVVVTDVREKVEKVLAKKFLPLESAMAALEKRMQNLESKNRNCFGQLQTVQTVAYASSVGSGSNSWVTEVSQNRKVALIPSVATVIAKPQVAPTSSPQKRVYTKKKPVGHKARKGGGGTLCGGHRGGNKLARGAGGTRNPAF